MGVLLARKQGLLGGAIMKLLRIRSLLLITGIGAAFAGVVSSNVSCGSDGEKTDGGGGSGGGGGGGGSGGGAGAVAPRFSNTFDVDKQSWTLSDYVDANYFNWGATTAPDSGVSLDGGVAPTIEWANEGDPDPGSLKVTVTFTGFKQYIDPQINLPTPQDFSGTHKIVKARIRLVSGSFPAGGIQFHVSSGTQSPNAYVYVSAPFINSTSLTVGQWITINLDTSTVAPTASAPTSSPAWPSVLPASAAARSRTR
jgi:hypothetical protein